MRIHPLLAGDEIDRVRKNLLPHEELGFDGTKIIKLKR
jgi:hypothetical protein